MASFNCEVKKDNYYHIRKLVKLNDFMIQCFNNKWFYSPGQGIFLYKSQDLSLSLLNSLIMVYAQLRQMYPFFIVNCFNTYLNIIRPSTCISLNHIPLEILQLSFYT
jgi:hypothetical protein